MKKDNKLQADTLRQRAEKELIKNKDFVIQSFLTEAESLKIQYELEVLKIELEMQHEQLFYSKVNVEFKEKFVNLFDYSPTAYIALSKDGDIVELNYCAANKLGKERLKLIKSRFGFFISEDTRPVFNVFFDRVIKNKKRETCKVILNTAPHSNRHAKLIGTFEEKSNQCFLTIIDIKDEVESSILTSKNTSELEKSNSDKALFLAIIAHDLRSSFTSITGLSHILMKNISKYNLDNIETYVSQINQSSINSSKLLENLLIWANVQSGQIEFNPQKLNCKTIFREVIELYNPILNERKIKLNFFIDEDLALFADSNMLLTIIRNIISNAIKYSNNGGEINISAVHSDSVITITVADTGIGFDIIKLEKIFDLSEAYSTKGTLGDKGTGLGLMLCKKFIELHKGNIWAESEIGIGSKFHFSLNQREKTTDIKTINWKHKSILFVDDESVTNILIQDLLEDTKVNIRFAINGEQAVKLSTNNHFDIIIMDINMPIMNGFEATTEIRKFNSNIIIIAHTSNILNREEYISAGFTDYLQKQGNQKNMLKLITKYLEY
jgi:signal transduction histidine kinase